MTRDQVSVLTTATKLPELLSDTRTHLMGYVGLCEMTGYQKLIPLIASQIERIDEALAQPSPGAVRGLVEKWRAEAVSNREAHDNSFDDEARAVYTAKADMADEHADDLSALAAAGGGDVAKCPATNCAASRCQCAACDPEFVTKLLSDDPTHPAPDVGVEINPHMGDGNGQG